ncbi:helicase [Brevibacterium aurantiacum]|uniref:helicase-related protein n=1 Tax=Brevibacterium aurantiacum TaxID=273384 RepID=UPI000F64617E|nr:helicase-related protein [Brevibacterium aurantiacum]AZL13425.1 helicase [Brevibacterium aurantiacum]
MSEERPDVESILAGLKPFQRATVEHVYARLWSDDDAVNRFLVADEVGLGKTMVAKGVAARAIDHLWEDSERTGKPITIVYICSNQQIARQNLVRLAQLTDGDVQTNADRLTMLPRTMGSAREQRVQVIAFTPGTSLNFGTGAGTVPERVLLHQMLTGAFPEREFSRRSWSSYLAGRAAVENFDDELSWAQRQEPVPADILASFRTHLEDEQGSEGQSFLEELFDHQSRWARTPHRTEELRRSRYPFIARMRVAMASAALERLQPDLVIMDEFQRFKDLFADDDSVVLPQAQKLAQRVINGEGAKTLVLSATPYKMYTLPDEADGDDHYRDFIDTVSFLAGREKAQEIARSLSLMRKGILLNSDDGVERAERARSDAEQALRSVMSRTERLAATADTDGMLEEKVFGDLVLTPSDVKGWRALDDISRAIGTGGAFEYWRSGPYTHNMMDTTGYKTQEKFLSKLEAEDEELLNTLRSHRDSLLPWTSIRHYKRVEPANPKLRALITDLTSSGAWKLAWISPSLPYFEPGGAYSGAEAQRFTKKLIFSAWNVVPKTIASLVSYEMERLAVASSPSESQKGRAYDDRTASPPLRFGWDTERDLPRNLPNLSVLYPSPALARVGDPLAVAQEIGQGLPLDLEAYGQHVETRITAMLNDADIHPQKGAEGLRRRWYGVAPFLLDRAAALREGWAAQIPHDAWSEGDGGGRLSDHARWALDPLLEEMGPPPEDLATVLTVVAAAAPGICALRAMTRISEDTDALYNAEVRQHALHAALGLRNLFNRPTLMAVVRGATNDSSNDADSYWRQVLRYCFDGNLQAVLDEYSHTLSAELTGVSTTEQAHRLANQIQLAASIRTAPNGVHDIRVQHGRATVETRQVNSHIAARFGRVQSNEGASEREATVRESFNSPFWPFVLASTSVGQEGLDFHTYSHAVVHWNLPSNPVDLEQREGRVHRYKGHAVRKNVADEYSEHAVGEPAGDPWERMFQAAEAWRPEGDSLLDPYWVKNGAAKIERYVPAMPLSRESRHYRSLVRTVGAYRFVLGQPRQEELIRFLGPHASNLRIDLSPPSSDRPE